MEMETTALGGKLPVTAEVLKGYERAFMLSTMLGFVLWESNCCIPVVFLIVERDKKGCIIVFFSRESLSSLIRTTIFQLVGHGEENDVPLCLL
jgi:hypothetical protein